MTPLVLVGAGGFGRETAEAVRAVNDVAPTWDLLGFLDDEPALHGTTVAGVPVLGGVDGIAAVDGAAVAICIASEGNQRVRQDVVARLGLHDDRYATIVHPAAAVAGSARVGHGSILLAGVVLTADVTVGAHVQMMPQVVATHDDVLADHTTFGAGVRLAGGVVVGEGAYVGAGALVRQGVVIGPGSLVGMGAVVLDDVPPDQVWAGVPARPLRCR